MKGKPLFALTPTEDRVFSILGQTSQQVAEIARLARLPRMTTHDVLKRLHGRRLIRKVPKGKRTHWKRADAQTLERHISHAQRALGVSKSRTKAMGTPHLSISDSLDIHIIHGVENLLRVAETAYTGNAGERVLLTQYASALSSFRTHLPEGELKRVNSIGKKYKGVLELLMPETSREEYGRFSSDPQWAETLIERRMAVSLIPDERMPDLPAELLIFRDQVMLTDWSIQTGILIKNKVIAQMMRMFFMNTHEHGETFNMQEFMQLLASLSEKHH